MLYSAYSKCTFFPCYVTDCGPILLIAVICPLPEFFVDHAYGWNCQQVCPGSHVMVDLVAALLIQMTDATSVVIGGTTPTIATVSAREEAVAAAGELTPGPLPPQKPLYCLLCSINLHF